MIQRTQIQVPGKESPKNKKKKKKKTISITVFEIIAGNTKKPQERINYAPTSYQFRIQIRCEIKNVD